MADLATLEGVLGIAFRDLSLLQQSLVHSSYLNENPDSSLPSNERMEFLGDAVLGLVVAEKVYTEFPDLSEGELTRLRSALVRRETLTRLAASLGLGNYLLLGRGEEGSGGRRRPRNLACALEALLGAILLDRGFDVAREFILRLIERELERAREDRLAEDYKSRLQEVVQAEGKGMPVYRTVSTQGPEHAKFFTVEVLLGDTVLGRGRGQSKRMAEKEAAKAALEGLGKDARPV